MSTDGTGGFLLVDKPAGMTSHDVVARARRALGTRKVGHAGTLDPMATGLLVIGVDAATRLLTFAVGFDKTYEATIRLGSATDTDDAEGEIITRADPGLIDALPDHQVDRGIAELTGEIAQVPTRVSAIKVNGRRAYDLARSGEEVVLTARQVVVSRFEVRARHRAHGACDVDVIVGCSSGTYVRALARDLGASLGVGGHLTALRRTRVGPFGIASAIGVDAIEPDRLLPVAETAAKLVGELAVTADEARALRQGKRLAGQASRLSGARAAAIDPAGALIGIVQARGQDLKSEMNMPEPAPDERARP